MNNNIGRYHWDTNVNWRREAATPARSHRRLLAARKTNSESCSENVPKLSARIPRLEAPQPRLLYGFFYVLGCRRIFFSGDFPSCFCGFQSSICLSFVLLRMFGDELCFRGWGGLSWNFSLKNLPFGQKVLRQRVLSFLASCFRVLLFLARCVRRVFGTEL